MIDFTYPEGALGPDALASAVDDGFWGGLGTAFRMTDIGGFANDHVPATELSERARRALAEQRAKLAPAAGA